MARRLIAVLLLLSFASIFGGVRPGQAIGESPLRKTMVILVDTSGSMKGLEEEVEAALTAFIDGLRAGWRVILVRFDLFSEVLDRADIAGQSDRERLKRRLEGLRFVGQKTNFDEGIKGAQASLFEEGVVENADVVIFSDGLSDPSHSKEVLDLTSLAQQVFPQRDGYSIYLLEVKTGLSPSQQVPATRRGNVTSMEVSRDNIPEVVRVIEQEAAPKAEAPKGVPPAPGQAERPDSSSPRAEATPAVGRSAWLASLWGWNWRWVPYALAGLALLLAGVGVYLGRGRLMGLLTGGQRGRPVSLQLYGRRDTLREFWLAEGESLRIGGGPCDYPLNTPSATLLTRQNGSLFVCPATSSSDVTLSGQRIQGSTPISRGAVIILDGHLYVEVNG